MNLLLKSNNAYANLIDKWAPFWLECFVDQKAGGFFERLGIDCQPLNMGYRRLVTQCRQIYVCSHAYILTADTKFLEAAHSGYKLINAAMRAQKCAGFHFSINSHGLVHDQSFDLYGHAFVLFSMAHYHRASQDNSALILARSTLDFINSHFKALPHNGYHEALDENLQPIKRVRRQNPHMHLLEGCLAMYEQTQETDYLITADSIIDLLQNHFFDAKTSTLGEFFDDKLQLDSESGHIVEPGHHFEWVWLLDKRLSLSPAHIDSAKLKTIMHALFTWARNHGIDKEHGGIFNEVNRQGVVLNSNKRIWALTESIKAYSIMLVYKTNNDDDLTQELGNLLHILYTHYVDQYGKWVEICNRDLSAQSDYLPGTTTYHIFTGIIESHGLLRSTRNNVMTSIPAEI